MLCALLPLTFARRASVQRNINLLVQAVKPSLTEDDIQAAYFRALNCIQRWQVPAEAQTPRLAYAGRDASPAASLKEYADGGYSVFPVDEGRIASRSFAPPAFR